MTYCSEKEYLACTYSDATFKIYLCELDESGYVFRCIFHAKPHGSCCNTETLRYMYDELHDHTLILSPNVLEFNHSGSKIAVGWFGPSENERNSMLSVYDIKETVGSRVEIECGLKEFKGSMKVTQVDFSRDNHMIVISGPFFGPTVLGLEGETSRYIILGTHDGVLTVAKPEEDYDEEKLEILMSSALFDGDNIIGAICRWDAIEFLCVNTLDMTLLWRHEHKLNGLGGGWACILNSDRVMVGDAHIESVALYGVSDKKLTYNFDVPFHIAVSPCTCNENAMLSSKASGCSWCGHNGPLRRIYITDDKDAVVTVAADNTLLFSSFEDPRPIFRNIYFEDDGLPWFIFPFNGVKQPWKRLAFLMSTMSQFSGENSCPWLRELTEDVVMRICGVF